MSEIKKPLPYIASNESKIVPKRGPGQYGTREWREHMMWNHPDCTDCATPECEQPVEGSRWPEHEMCWRCAGQMGLCTFCSNSITSIPPMKNPEDCKRPYFTGDPGWHAEMYCDECQKYFDEK